MNDNRTPMTLEETERYIALMEDILLQMREKAAQLKSEAAV